VNSGPLASSLVRLTPAVPPTPSPPPGDIPANPAAPTNLAGGVDEVLSTLLPANYQDGLDSLVPYKDVNLVAIPDRTDAIVQAALVAHCQGVSGVGDSFAILDSRLGAPPSGAGSVVEQQASVVSPRGYAALYYPWLLVDAGTGSPGAPPPPPLLVPPSGHVAGLYAASDSTRGVHKAPAGMSLPLNGVIAVERRLSDVDQGPLNADYGINVIRVFRTGGQAIVWGARTTATGTDDSWRYVNIRRLFLFLEGSILRTLRLYVFDANDTFLWGKLKRSISAFLTQAWRDGALFGATAKEAFYVRIDEVLNPPDQRELGRLTIEIGVVPSYPAEFIVIRIGIWEGGSQVIEQ
jgi:phage tail sheath protein FI